MSEQRTALLVLGMHRSGTSAVTRMLALMGASLGEDLLPPAADNVRGFWENRGFVDLHQEAFERLGIDWDSPEPMPQDWLKSGAGRALYGRLRDELQHQFAGSPLFAVKDPRMSRLLPAWIAALSDSGIRPVNIIVVRHPDEVAASLVERDSLPQSLSRLLWIRYLLDAELASRGQRRVFVHYERVLGDWRGQIQRIGEVAGLEEWPSRQDAATVAIEKFLDADLRHHRAVKAASLPGLLATVYRLALAASEGEVIDEVGFDAARIALDDHLTLFGGVPKKHYGRPGANAPVAHAGAMVETLWEQQLGVPRGEICKVYYRADAVEYAEDRALSQRLTSGLGPVTARFELPIAADFVRIDLAEAPGLFRVVQIEAGGRPLPDPQRRLLRVNGRRLSSALGEFCRLLAEDDDPYLEIDLRGVWEQEETRDIAVCYERESLQSQLMAFAESLSPTARLVALEQVLAALKGEISSGLEALRQSHAAFEGSAQQQWSSLTRDVEANRAEVSVALERIARELLERVEHINIRREQQLVDVSVALERIARELLERVEHINIRREQQLADVRAEIREFQALSQSRHEDAERLEAVHFRALQDAMEAHSNRIEHVIASRGLLARIRAVFRRKQG